jgi:methylated-DNA-[protein]-cysteine S-methyltransferase
MTYSFDTFPTPLGDFSVVLDAVGAVVATTFGGEAELHNYLPQDTLVRDPQLAAEARRQVTEFFAGQRRRFNLKLAPRGTPFQKRVWSVLEQIPFGETRSYGQIAVAIGQPGAARAVGRANGANPICLVVPCHRVIGADGSLTGFALGEHLKRRLLEHEGAQTFSLSSPPG